MFQLILVATETLVAEVTYTEKTSDRDNGVKVMCVTNLHMIHKDFIRFLFTNPNDLVGLSITSNNNLDIQDLFKGFNIIQGTWYLSVPCFHMNEDC